VDEDRMNDTLTFPGGSHCVYISSLTLLVGQLSVHDCLSGMRCIYFAYSPAADDTATSSSLALFKSRMANLPFRYWLTSLSWKKSQLDGCLIV